MMYPMGSILFWAFFLMNMTGFESFLDQKELTKKELNSCQRCQVMTESFHYWLDKTSRGKYEGGDAAWEEAKLKSYSRSEIRLIEVQEGLCSELKRHQSDCYILAEETESLIESFWFLEESNLFLWLCIDKLQYCCPKDHFGASCDQCPFGKNNKVCTGHGKCVGGGTRQGNGTCLCQNGYIGNLCDECAHNFYQQHSECLPCHKACDGCVGTGAHACKACKSGWHSDLNGCVDIDECLDSLTCKHNEYCSNIEGSYTCNVCHGSCKTCKGNDSVNCTSCDDNSVLWSGTCVNDELKNKILYSALKRLGQYLGLFTIAYFVMRHSRRLSTLTVAIIAVYIYYSEKSYEIDIAKIFSYLYLS